MTFKVLSCNFLPIVGRDYKEIQVNFKGPWGQSVYSLLTHSGRYLHLGWGQLSELISQNRFGNNGLFNLLGPFINFQDLGVTIKALNFVLINIALAPMHLDSFVGAFDGNLGRRPTASKSLHIHQPQST